MWNVRQVGQDLTQELSTVMASIYLLTKLKVSQTPEQRELLTSGLEEHFLGRWMDIGRDNYLVATTEPYLTRQLAEMLKVRDGQVGSYLLTKVEERSGYGSSSMWEWFGNMRELE